MSRYKLTMNAGNQHLGTGSPPLARGLQPAACRLPPIARRRRGVLLLVILSLLILFVMIALTYVLVATRHLQASRANARSAITGEPPQELLDGGIMQIIRGAPGTGTNISPIHSVIGPWSLLEHMYGTNTVPGTITNSKFYVNNQILDFTASLPASIEGFYEGCVLTFTDSRSAAHGISARVVRNYIDNAGMQHLRVLTPKPRGLTLTANDFDNYSFIINGRAFSGTGFGFNPQTGGLAAGDSTGRQFALLPNPVAYRPDSTYGKYAPGGSFPNGLPFGGLGGGNMDYDAPDYQHMWMAWIVENPPGNVQVVLPSYHRPDLIYYWLTRTRSSQPGKSPPWDWNDPGTSEKHKDPLVPSETIPDGQYLLSRICLRPTPLDHPNFTGSNQYLGGTTNFIKYIYGRDPTTGSLFTDTNGNPIIPWDVDNDNDGIPDSIWLDLGYPVEATSDGRLYKPLFAPLVIDLDGRLNINAHGTTEQISTADSYAHSAMPPAGPFAGTNGSTPYAFTRGEGYGPAEIDLAIGLGGTPMAATDAAYLMRGDSASGYQGRYGGTAGGTDEAGQLNVDSPLGLVKHFQWPDNAFSMMSAYMSPSDTWGRGSVAIDYNGQPYYMRPILSPGTTMYTNALQGEARNSPYDLNLSHDLANPANPKTVPATLDNPFTVFELEKLLRPYDIDSQGLPDRLAALLKNSITSTPLLRNRLTTDTFDPPSPSAIAPPSLRATSPPHSITEMLSKRLLSGTSPLSSQTDANKAIRDLLSPDLIAGLRMNINRPLGEARDSDGNGVVDDPTGGQITKDGSSTATNKWAPQTMPSLTSFNNVSFNLTNGMNVMGPDPSGKWHVNGLEELHARQLMARYLYILARLMIDDDFLGKQQAAFPKNANNHWFDNDPAVVDGPTQRKASIRRIAQWAVNVVDFMDADSIMTPFEYDEQPFSHSYTDPTGAVTDKDPANKWRTWCVDNVIDDGTGTVSQDDTKPWRGLVWGCERPELLITETFAFHDRRTEDTDQETVDNTEGDNHQKKKTTDSTDPDASFDQRLMPRAGFFVELYNPWADNGSVRPGEFYSSPTSGGVQLNRLSGGARPSPMWRMLIVKDNKDPDDPNSPAPASDIDRSVYFTDMTNAAALTVPTDGGTAYYSSAAVSAQFAPLLPGRYALVGSSGDDPPTAGIGYEITMGRKKGVTEGTAATRRTDLQISTTRRIVLNPSVNPNVNQVQINSNTVAGSPDALSQPPDVQPEIAIVVDKPRSLNLTAPNPRAAAGAVPARPLGYPTDATDPVLTAHGITWDATLAGGEGAYNPTIDIPLDYDLGVQTDPTLLAELRLNGIKKDFRRVHLQRLANPLLPWNKFSNPYITVDSMSVPLTKFNGIEDTNVPTPHDDPISGKNPDVFATHERGDENPSPVDRNLWRHDFTAGDTATIAISAADSTHVFGRQLQNTLGYLNKSYGPAFTSATAPVSANDIGGQKFYAGSPDATKHTFPWLPWNNRPYASVGELMFVPSCQSSQLARQYSNLDGAAGADPYANDIGGAANQKIPFGYTMNFFYAEKFGGTAGKAPNLATMLEYLQVPSPFVGTETVLNPQPSPTGFGWNANTGVGRFNGPLLGETSSGDYLPNPSAGNEPDGTRGLHPPFNTVSTFRDPGRVNINTIASDAVWNAVLGYTPSAQLPGTTFTDVAQSRQGYTGAAFNANSPSIFSNPFRSAAGSDMVPLPALVHKPVNVTFWRAEGVNPDTTGKAPLLARNDANTPAIPNDEYKNWQRNPYFYYQSLDRLTNKLTTRSNVYAVWVTVGYFEVSPWYGANNGVPNTSGPQVFDQAHPDGYQLGQELGADTGEIQRHRGFYIIDRTIPVGFQRGVDNNASNCILLKRFIE
jgi:hypothetical protein